MSFSDNLRAAFGRLPPGEILTTADFRTLASAETPAALALLLDRDSGLRDRFNAASATADFRAALGPLPRKFQYLLASSPPASAIPPLTPVFDLSHLPADWQTKIARVLNRIHIMDGEISLIRNNAAYRGKEGLDEAELKKGFKTLPGFPSLLQEDRDYLKWLLLDCLEDAVGLHQLGAVPEAEAQLEVLLRVSQIFRSLGPYHLYRLNRAYIPQGLLVREAKLKALWKAVTFYMEKQIHGYGPSLGEIHVPFSPEEALAWERVKEEVLQFTRHSANTGEDIRRALIAIGIPEETFLSSKSRRHRKIFGKNLFASISREAVEGVPADIRGKIYIAEGAIPRKAVLAHLAIWLAEQEGLINHPDNYKNWPLIFSFLRSAQLNYLISVFLMEEGRALEARALHIQNGILSPLGLTSDGTHILTTASTLPYPVLRPPDTNQGRTENVRAMERQYMDQGYHGLEEDYEQVNVLLDELEGMPAGPALSLGSGLGMEPLIMADPHRKGPIFTQVDAVEASIVAHHRARRIWERYGAGLKINPILADVTLWEWSVNRYSWVLAKAILHLLPSDTWISFIQKMRGALLPEGRASLIVPAAVPEMLRKVSHSPPNRRGGVDYDTKTGLKGHLFSSIEMTDLFQQAGLEEDEVEIRPFGSHKDYFLAHLRSPRTTLTKAFRRGTVTLARR